MLGKVNNRLFPHCATETVRQVVHLIHHHVAQAGQRGRVSVEHVAQHLGGHHDHGCFRVNARIAGQQTHVILTVRAHEVVVLLVAQRLNGGRVERLHAAAQRQVDTELTHNGLTGTRRRGNEDGTVRLHGGTRLTLKIIQRKIQGRFKSSQGGLRVGCALSGCGVGGSVVGAGLLVRSGRSVCVGLCVVLAHSMSSVTVHPPRASRKHPARALIRYGRTASASAVCERGGIQVLCTPPLAATSLNANYLVRKSSLPRSNPSSPGLHCWLRCSGLLHPTPVPAWQACGRGACR